MAQGLTLAPLTDVDIGAIAAAAIALAAFRTRSLSAAGAFAAFVVGAVTYGALGPPGGAILLAFFVTSVGLSRVGRARKRAALLDVDKTGARDAAQVFANGGIAALCALLAHVLAPRYSLAFAGAFAAATADTWGTEIGTLARHGPRSILTFQPVATGLSGGVTLPGTLAEIAGALTIAAVAHASLSLDVRGALAIASGGIAGALTDSVLGASIQALRWCPQCLRATEREPHGCGANTTPLRGITWFGNDAVNAAATLVGASVAFAFGA
jgi:uncharacterized protein (TIGR00297 family)